MFSLLLAPYPVKDKVPVIFNFVEWFLYDGKIGLNPLSTIIALLNSLKHHGFLMFSGGTEVEQCLIMG